MTTAKRGGLHEAHARRHGEQPRAAHDGTLVDDAKALAPHRRQEDLAATRGGRPSQGPTEATRPAGDPAPRSACRLPPRAPQLRACESETASPLSCSVAGRLIPPDIPITRHRPPSEHLEIGPVAHALDHRAERLRLGGML